MNTIATGTNARASMPMITVSRTTRDGVQLFKVEDQETLVAYTLDRNAFSPVNTREQATRVATGSYEPTDDAIGKQLKKRKSNKKGKGAKLMLDVKENRGKHKTKEEEEETLED